MGSPRIPKVPCSVCQQGQIWQLQEPLYARTRPNDDPLPLMRDGRPRRSGGLAVPWLRSQRPKPCPVRSLGAYVRHGRHDDDLRGGGLLHAHRDERVRHEGTRRARARRDRGNRASRAAVREKGPHLEGSTDRDSTSDGSRSATRRPIVGKEAIRTIDLKNQ